MAVTVPTLSSHLPKIASRSLTSPNASLDNLILSSVIYRKTIGPLFQVLSAHDFLTPPRALGVALVASLTRINIIWGHYWITASFLLARCLRVGARLAPFSRYTTHSPPLTSISSVEWTSRLNLRSPIPSRTGQRLCTTPVKAVTMVRLFS